jgi:hypothetical protein
MPSLRYDLFGLVFGLALASLLAATTSLPSTNIASTTNIDGAYDRYLLYPTFAIAISIAFARHRISHTGEASLSHSSTPNIVQRYNHI